MKNNRNTLVFLCMTFCFGACKGQSSFGSNELFLKQTIPMNEVKGRIDHLDANLKNQIVYIAALGNNSLEVVDLKNGKSLHSVKGLDEPQGVVYIPQTNEIMVANGGNGQCKFYNAKTLENTATIDLGSDADDVRYDSIEKKIYVGYGNGGIAVVDAVDRQKIADLKLTGHPEGFQLDKQINKLFVNVPDANQIDVIDLEELKIIARWKTEYGANFPMTVDVSHHIVFIGYRHPGKLVAINAMTGKSIAIADLISDVDDIYFDTSTNKLYASGGGGAINIFSFNNSKFTQIAYIPTKTGARTSLLIPQLNTFVLAERAGGGPARLQVYSINK